MYLHLHSPYLSPSPFLPRFPPSNPSLSHCLCDDMKVNGTDMSTATHDQAIRLLKTSPDPLSVLVRHEAPPPGLQVQYMYIQKEARQMHAIQ